MFMGKAKATYGIRVSPAIYDEVFDIAEEREVSMTEALEMLILRLRKQAEGVKPEPEIEAKPKPKPEPPKPEPEKEPWPWTRPRGVNYKCGKCGNMIEPKLKEGHEKFCRKHKWGWTV